MRVIGLISGTSTDGIDAALVEVGGAGEDLRLKLLRYRTYPYPAGVRPRLLALATRHRPLADLCHLNVYLGELFAQAAQSLAREAGMSLSEINLIGSHGQTVQHLPHPRKEGVLSIRSTLQIGEPSVIAERTGVTTVADFRPRDIAAGGEGAPLTPYLHHHLFRDPVRTRMIVNIGGISNVTFLPAGKGLESVIAFDTGPGNMLIDGLMQRGSNGRKRMDRHGRTALAGVVHARLLRLLMKHPFLHRPPPKTTGREAFGSLLLDRLLRHGRRFALSHADLVATATAFTAHSIAFNYDSFLKPIVPADEVVVGGGGVRNPALMDPLRELLRPAQVRTFEDFGMDSKAVEAMAFALLAYEAFRGHPNNVPSATGASRPVVMGKILPGRK